MGAFDPVSWGTIETAIGPPASEITVHVEQLQEEVTGADAYEAVKTVHDAIDESGVDRTVSSVGEPFVTAYLLERAGVIAPAEDAPDGYRSIVHRRPETDRLRHLFWDEKRTLWWIGLLAGVHPALVTYWLYEDDIPLMERNFTDDSMEKIRAVRASTDR